MKDQDLIRFSIQDKILALKTEIKRLYEVDVNIHWSFFDVDEKFRDLSNLKQEAKLYYSYLADQLGVCKELGIVDSWDAVIKKSRNEKYILSKAITFQMIFDTYGDSQRVRIALEQTFLSIRTSALRYVTSTIPGYLKYNKNKAMYLKLYQDTCKHFNIAPLYQ